MRPSLNMVSSLIFSPLQLHFFTVLVIFLTFGKWNGVNGNYYYENCSSSLISCGNIKNIGYPFWSDQLYRPKYCGHPAMKLQCHHLEEIEYPILILGGNEGTVSPSFQVLNISNFVITISLLDLDSPSPHCLTPSDIIVNDLDDQKWVTYSSSVKNIKLSYECDRERIDVSKYDTISVCETRQVYYLRRLSDIKFCKNYRFPVLIKEFDDYRERRIQTLENMFSKGFEVEFLKSYSDLCQRCRHSGGECGSPEQDNDSQFTCYCENGPHPNSCPASAPTPAVPGNTRHKKHALKLTISLAIGIPVGIVILITLIVGILWCTKHKSRSPTFLSRTIADDHIMSDVEFGNSFLGIPVFSYTELQEATNNFDRELGDGGFGVVYYGKLRDGREVAVKRLYERNYKRVQQFRNEVEILTKLSHPNLVTLYGCSSRHSRELLLVYEYIPNGTVADHLYEDLSASRLLAWNIRMKIAIQTSEALSYLHASDIIHRDIKTNNILLDSNFTVKVADFGLSRLFPLDVTHITTAPQGTPGYLDPEYDTCYKVTDKSDVYSFGVVLIELISSLPAIDFTRSEDETNLSTYAVNKIRNGKLDELVDKRLGFESDFEVNRMVSLVAELAFQCLDTDKEVRPSMKEVLERLKRIKSVDYETLEIEEMQRGDGISKTTSRITENNNEVDQQEQLNLRDGQNMITSPKSVIVGLNSGSTVSNTSG